MTLPGLQLVINRSIQDANPLTRKLFADQPWDAKRVQAFVNDVGGITVATVSTAGVPHAAVVVAGSSKGRICFAVSPESVLLRNLTAGSAVAFTLVGDGHCIVGQGVATSRGETKDLSDLVAALGPQFRLGNLILDPWDGLIYEIKPSRLFAQ